MEGDPLECPHENSGTLLYNKVSQAWDSSDYYVSLDVSIGASDEVGEDIGGFGIAWRVLKDDEFYGFDW